MTTAFRALVLGTMVGLFAVDLAAHAQDKTIKIGALFPMSSFNTKIQPAARFPQRKPPSA